MCSALANVRFGSKADICSAKRHVRFTPNSDRKSGFPHKVMSASPPKADMCSALAYVCFGPIADISYAVRSTRVSLTNNRSPLKRSVRYITRAVGPCCCSQLGLMLFRGHKRTRAWIANGFGTDQPSLTEGPEASHDGPAVAHKDDSQCRVPGCR